MERCGEQLLSYSQPIETDSDIRVPIMSLDRMLLLANAARGQTFEASFDLETANVVWADYDEDWRRRIGFEAALTKASDGLVTYQFSCWINSTSSEFKATGKITVKNVTTLLDDRYTKSAKSELFFYVQNMKSGHVKATNFSIKLVQNTAYTPYTGQTTALTLPRAIYGGTVDAVSGEGQETWKIYDNFNSHRINKDGTEAGWVQSEDAVAWYISSLQPALNKPKVLSNVFHTISSIVTTAVPYTMGANANYVAFRLPRSVAATEDDVKRWLIANDVKIALEIKDQTPFTATGAQPIPALPGVNTLMTDADSVAVTGRADPIKRITDLEDAVASMT